MGSIPGSGRSPGAGNTAPIFLPRKFHGQSSLVSYSPWGHKESDTTKHMVSCAVQKLVSLIRSCLFLSWNIFRHSVQFSSVAQSCPTLCDPMNRSTPGLPVHHKLPEFTQTHAHWVSDAIQPSHPLSSPSPPAPNPSQHQGLFQRVSSSHEVAKVLGFQLQRQSFQWAPRTYLLQNGLVGSPYSPRDSQESSPTP